MGPSRATPAPRPRRLPWVSVGGACLAFGCSGHAGAASEIESLLAGYRAEMAAELAEVVGYATGPFAKADPEGALDNLVADAVLHAARQEVDDTVHAALLNDGGLRVPLLASGPLLMTHAFELLPFRNYLTVLTLSGEEMERLADEIAASRGEPVAGWTMMLDGDDAVDVRVGGEPVDPARDYKLVTVDYLVDGGGARSLLWDIDPSKRRDVGLLIRDAFVRYVSEMHEVSPVLDGRIRFVEAPRGSRSAPPRDATESSTTMHRDGPPAVRPRPGARHARRRRSTAHRRRTANGPRTAGLSAAPGDSDAAPGPAAR